MKKTATVFINLHSLALFFSYFITEVFGGDTTCKLPSYPFGVPKGKNSYGQLACPTFDRPYYRANAVIEISSTISGSLPNVTFDQNTDILNSGTSYNLEMCYSTGRTGPSYLPPKGTYCWLQTPGTTCSEGGASTNLVTADAADLHFSCRAGASTSCDNNKLSLKFCCYNNADQTVPSEMFPNDQITLFRSGGRCQEVVSMTTTPGFLTITSGSNLNVFTITNSLDVTTTANSLTLHLCHYKKEKCPVYDPGFYLYYTDLCMTRKGISSFSCKYCLRYRYCTDFVGFWDNDEPHCGTESCSDPGSIMDSTIQTSDIGTFTYYTTQHYTCNNGDLYSEDLYCTYNGIWDNPLQQCVFGIDMFECEQEELHPKLKLSNATWKIIISNAITQICSMVPEVPPLVGKIANILVSLFWPSDKTNVFESLKKEIGELVDARILNFELKQYQGEINGLQLDLLSYRDALSHEKGTILTAILVQCRSLFGRMGISDGRHHLVPVMINVGMIHLNMLRERSLFGNILFEEDNQKVWDQELLNDLAAYQEKLKQMYLEWVVWRKLQIDTFHRPSRTPPMPQGDSAEGYVHDRLTNRKVTWYDWGNQDDVFAPEVLVQKQSWFSVANADYFSFYSKSFHFSKFIPHQEKNAPTIPPEFKTLDVGPLYWDDPRFTGQDSDGYSNRPKNPDNWDMPGKVVGILVREYNSIDALQIQYAGHDGHYVGNPTGGIEHIHAQSDDKRLTAVGVGFNNLGLAELTLIDSDGTNETATVYGNRGGWLLRRTSFFVPDSEGYMLNSVAMSTFAGTVGEGITALHFKFEARSDNNSSNDHNNN